MKLPPSRRVARRDFGREFAEILNASKRVMGDPLPLGVDREIRAISRSYVRRLRAYAHSVRAGEVERARSLEFEITQAFGSRVVAVLKGYSKKAPKASLEQIKLIASHVDVRHAVAGERMKVIEVSKADGGKRPITLLTTYARARGCLVKDLVTIRKPSVFEYARKGRGREAAVVSITNSIENGGVRALGSVDIKSCFPSIRRTAVYEALPLPKAIIDNSIFIPPNVAVRMRTAIVSENAVRGGLIQGAMPSVVVAGKVIEPILRALEARWTASYIDNILIGGGNLEEVNARLDTLTDLLKGWYPASPLFTRDRQAGKLGEHVDVLGYWLRPKSIGGGGGVAIRPSERSLRRLYHRLGIACLQTENDRDWYDLTERLASCWASGFPAWQGREMGVGDALVCFADTEARLLSMHARAIAAKRSGVGAKEFLDYVSGMAREAIPNIVLQKTTGNCIPAWGKPSPYIGHLVDLST